MCMRVFCGCGGAGRAGCDVAMREVCSEFLIWIRDYCIETWRGRRWIRIHQGK